MSLFSTAAPASKMRGAEPLRQHVRTRSARRVLLAGDAAGYVDALTGKCARQIFHFYTIKQLETLGVGGRR